MNALNIWRNKVLPHLEEMDDDVIFEINPDELKVEIIGLLNNDEMEHLDRLLSLATNTIDTWKADLTEDIKSNLKCDISNILDGYTLGVSDMVEVLIECAHDLYYG